MTGPVARPKLIDPFLDKIEEWVERSEGKVRADKVHERLVPMGFAGNERTTRRAVAAARARGRAGHARTYRPWTASQGCGFSGTGARARGCRGRTGRCGNGRVHRERCAASAQRLEIERPRLHRLPGPVCRRAWHRPGGEHRPDRPVRQRALTR